MPQRPRQEGRINTRVSMRALQALPVIALIGATVYLYSGQGETFLRVSGNSRNAVITRADSCLNEYFLLSEAVSAGTRTLSLADSPTIPDRSWVLVIQPIWTDSLPAGEEARGNYEYQQVDSCRGGRLYLSRPLRHSYPVGHTQIVSIPSLEQITLRPGASISCPPYQAGRGGIVALLVAGNIHLPAGAGIDVSGKGVPSPAQMPEPARLADYHRSLWLGRAPARQADLTSAPRSGGMILILAAGIQGKGAIRANGESAPKGSTTQAGAGGSILLNVSTPIPSRVEANGGAALPPTGQPGNGGLIAETSATTISNYQATGGQLMTQEVGEWSGQQYSLLTADSGHIFHNWIPPYPADHRFVPVKWVNTNVYSTEREQIIQWSVTRELSVDAYEVQQSIAGQPFETVGRVPAHADRSDAGYYQMAASQGNLSAGQEVLYRVVQLFDGGRGNPSPLVKARWRMAEEPIIFCPPGSRDIQISLPPAWISAAHSSTQAYFIHESELDSLRYASLLISQDQATFRDARSGHYLIYLHADSLEVTRQVFVSHE